MAYFFVQVSTDTSTAVTNFTVNAWRFRPSDHRDAGYAATAQLAWTAVQSCITASANKVSSITTGVTFSAVGVRYNVTVVGNAGTVGGDYHMIFTPAAVPSWPAGVYQLVGTHFTAGSISHTDLLLIPAADAQNVATYQMVYYFAPLSTSLTARISPVGYIQSGNPMKHSDIDPSGGDATTALLPRQ